MSPVASLLLIPTVKEVLKSPNISQSYERILSGMFFMAHGVYTCISNSYARCFLLEHSVEGASSIGCIITKYMNVIIISFDPKVHFLAEAKIMYLYFVC